MYRNSVGHDGLYCEACHGSTHAILPSLEPNDNIQNIALQGHAGTLSDCTVCHASVPDGPGPHGIRPSLTPEPSATVPATVQPTQTPEPTETRKPTKTPEPTETPKPTKTPGRQKVEFKGLVQARPANRIGVWRIGDRDVLVDASTRFDESKGQAAIGVEVEVKGYEDASRQIQALRITVKNSVATPAPTVKFIGVIERLPATGLIGVWQVGEHRVSVTDSTEIEGEPARYRIGASVKIRGQQDAEGLVTATKVELYDED